MKYKTTYTRSTAFDFGKYKGQTLQEVKEKDPSYVEWAQKNVSWFCIEEEPSQQKEPCQIAQREPCLDDNKDTSTMNSVALCRCVKLLLLYVFNILFKYIIQIK